MHSNGTWTNEADGTTVLRFERRLGHPAEEVWAALTEPARLIAWWGDADLELRAGGRFVVRWLNTDDAGNSFTLEGTVSELEPPRVLEIESDPDEGHGTLRFELEADGEETILRFSSTLELPDELRSRTLAGWHYHLDALAGALDGRRADLVELPGWDEIHAGYVGAG